MNQQAAPAGQSAVTMDKLETLVQKAAYAIDTLQTENASLKAELKRHEAAAAVASAQRQEQAARISELEQAQAGLKDDAAWSRWFRNKYAGSTFYHHIEAAYRQESQPRAAIAAGEPQQDAVAA